MSQTRSVEWLLASMMVAWGVGLMLPGDTMLLPQYRLLAAIAPEPVWAAWSLSTPCGSGQSPMPGSSRRPRSHTACERLAQAQRPHAQDKAEGGSG